MADPKSVTTLQSVKITCSEINDETLKMRCQFDAWLDKSRTALDDLTASHKNTMQKLDESNGDLMKKYKALKAESAKIQKEEEKQRQELQLVEMRIAQLRDKENTLPQQLEQTRKTLQKNLQSISTLRTQIDEHLKQRKEKQADLEKGSLFYATRLGLTFERQADKPGNLSFVFTQIDPRDHGRQFSFVVRVDENEYYQVLECNPPIKLMPELVKQLNKTNDLSAYVRAVRAEFHALVQ